MTQASFLVNAGRGVNHEHTERERERKGGINKKSTPPSFEEIIIRKVWRAQNLLERGIREYQDGWQKRDTSAVAFGCRKILNALVEITDAVLLKHGVKPHWGGSAVSTRRSTQWKVDMNRRGGLILINRGDLESVYARARSDLEAACWLMNENPADLVLKHTIAEIVKTVNRESKSLLGGCGTKFTAFLARTGRAKPPCRSW